MRKIESCGNTVWATRLSSPCGRQIASERFFDDDARMLRQIRRAQSFDHRLEQRRWDGEVVRRAPRAAERFLYRRKRLRVLIIPTDVLELRQKIVERALVVDPTGSLDAVRHAFAQTRQTPLRESDADYGDLEIATLRHRIECGEDHLVGEIARHSEEH